MATVINTVRKKVSLNLRNVPDSLINISPALSSPAILNDGVYYNNTGSDTSFFVPYSLIKTTFDTISSPRSLIVIGGDIFIDTGIILPNNTPTHAIIALKNDLGVGGNIYIR